MMESNIIRILLLIALFFLLTGDYTALFKHVISSVSGNDQTANHNNKREKSEVAYSSNEDADKTFDSIQLTKRKLLNTVKNSCLPKLICELNASPNKDNLSQSEVALLNLIRDTSISTTAEVTSKYHFAAHMGQLISGIEGNGCHNFYPDCPLPGFKVMQIMKNNIRFK